MKDLIKPFIKKKHPKTLKKGNLFVVVKRDSFYIGKACKNSVNWTGWENKIKPILKRYLDGFLKSEEEEGYNNTKMELVDILYKLGYEIYILNPRGFRKAVIERLVLEEL